MSEQSHDVESARELYPHLPPEVASALYDMQWDTRVEDARARRAEAIANTVPVSGEPASGKRLEPIELMGESDEFDRELRRVFTESYEEAKPKRRRGGWVFALTLSVSAIAIAVPLTVGGSSVGGFLDGFGRDFGSGNTGGGSDTVVPVATVDGPIERNQEVEESPEADAAEVEVETSPGENHGPLSENILPSELGAISRPLGELPSLNFGTHIVRGPAVAAMPRRLVQPESETTIGLFALPLAHEGVISVDPVASAGLFPRLRTADSFSPESAPLPLPSRSPAASVDIASSIAPGQTGAEAGPAPGSEAPLARSSSIAAVLAAQDTPRAFSPEEAPAALNLTQPAIAGSVAEPATPEAAEAFELALAAPLDGVGVGHSPEALAALGVPGRTFAPQSGPGAPILDTPLFADEIAELAVPNAGEASIAGDVARSELDVAAGDRPVELAALSVPAGFVADPAPDLPELPSPTVATGTTAPRAISAGSIEIAGVLPELSFAEKLSVNVPAGLSADQVPQAVFEPESAPGAPNLTTPNPSTEIAGLSETGLPDNAEIELPDNATGALSGAGAPDVLAAIEPTDSAVFTAQPGPTAAVREGPDLAAAAPSSPGAESSEVLALVLPRAGTVPLADARPVGPSGDQNLPAAFSPEASASAVDLVQPAAEGTAPDGLGSLTGGQISAVVVSPSSEVAPVRVDQPENFASLDQGAGAFTPSPAPELPALTQPSVSTDLGEQTAQAVDEVLAVPGPTEEALATGAEDVALATPIVPPRPLDGTPDAPSETPASLNTGDLLKLGGSAKLLVYAPSGIDGNRVEEVQALLSQAGVTGRDPASVPFEIRRDQIRYYHESDFDDAVQLASLTGSELRDFTKNNKLPPIGTIELWLAGVPTAEDVLIAAISKATAAKPKATAKAVRTVPTKTVQTASASTKTTKSRKRNNDDRADSGASGGGGSGGGGGSSGGGGGGGGAGRDRGGDRDFGG